MQVIISSYGVPGRDMTGSVARLSEGCAVTMTSRLHRPVRIFGRLPSIRPPHLVRFSLTIDSNRSLRYLAVNNQKFYLVDFILVN